MSSLKVSVIIPVHNAESTIGRCLESVLTQDLGDFEVVCIDDGSTDGSLNVLRYYQAQHPRITILEQKNEFAGVARNNGMRVARGEYLAFVDADDWMETGALLAAYTAAHDNDVDMLKAPCRYFDCKSHEFFQDDWIALKVVPPDSFNKVLDYRSCPWLLQLTDAPWSGMYKRAFIERYDIQFDSLRCVNDSCFFIKALVLADRVLVLDRLLVTYVVNQSRSLAVIRPYFFHCQLDVYRNLKEFLSRLPSFVNSEAILKCFMGAITHRVHRYLGDCQLSYQNKEEIIRVTREFVNALSEEEMQYGAGLSLLKIAFNELSPVAICNNYRDYGKFFHATISIIIPIYNVADYLSRCLNSIIGQTYKFFEIICVDDGSYDDSLAVLRQYAERDSRIKILSQPNMGQGAARNAGIRAAVGDYIYFVDADDWIEQDCLAELYRTISTSCADVCLVGAKKFGYEQQAFVDNHYVSYRNYDAVGTSVFVYSDFKQDLFERFGPCLKMVSRSFLLTHEIVFAEQHYYEDVLFSIKVKSLAEKIAVCRKDLYVYCVNRPNSTMTEQSSAKFDDIFVFLKDVQDYLRNQQLLAELEPWFYDFINEQLRFHFTRAQGCFKYYVADLAKRYTVNNLDYERLVSGYSNPIFDYWRQPFVSVIVCAYNAQQYLVECLNSLVHQTLYNIEIICVDDSSSDDTLKILNTFAAKDPRRVRVVHNLRNHGLAYSRNRAIRIARGQYLQFVDADDYLASQTCQILFMKARRLNLDMLSFAGINFEDKTGQPLNSNYYNFKYLPVDWQKEVFTFEDVREFINRMAVSSCLTVYNRDFVEANQIEFPVGYCFEDNLFFTKALFSAKAVSIEKQQLYFRCIHKASITQNRDRHFRDSLHIVDLVLSYIASLNLSDGHYLAVYTAGYMSVVVSCFNSFGIVAQRRYYRELVDFCHKYNYPIARIRYKYFGSLNKGESSFKMLFGWAVFGNELSRIHDGVKRKISILGVECCKMINGPNFKRFSMFGLTLFKKIKTETYVRVSICGVPVLKRKILGTKKRMFVLGLPVASSRVHGYEVSKRFLCFRYKRHHSA